ncbi:hypothetical protein BHM03_00003010 [Ensete ventricosum]|nr:hypothetical protein BHM03_00003010 [Ensete ventricosum]
MALTIPSAKKRERKRKRENLGRRCPLTARRRLDFFFAEGRRRLRLENLGTMSQTRRTLRGANFVAVFFSSFEATRKRVGGLAIGIIRATEELDCSSAHIRLREPDKLEDKVDNGLVVGILKRVLEEVEKVMHEFRGMLYKSMEDPELDLADVSWLLPCF